MSVTITGLNNVLKKLNDFELDLDEVIDDAVRITAIKVQQTAIKKIRTPSVGTYVKRYTESGKAYDHVASKEGDAPNTDTGRLIGSITVDHHKGQQVAYVGTNVDYGFFLETVMNRPWLEVSKVEEMKNFKKNMNSAVDLQIKKAGK